jgi:hypothetical protein
MARLPSEATQLRTAKREAKELRDELWQVKQERHRALVRLSKAEDELAEWKERFDILLRRDQENPS